MGLSISAFLIFVGGTILIGVFGNFLFDKTKVPTPVILIFLGIFLGPITGLIGALQLAPFVPYVGTLALILILFEGGLELDLRSVLLQAKSAAIIGLVTYIITASAIGLISFYLLRYDLQSSVFFSLVLAGTSPAIVLPVLQKMNLGKEASALFSMESVLSEVLTVTFSILAIDVLDPANESGVVAQVYLVAHVIWISLLIAVLSAWLWNWFMPHIERLGLSQMLTLACLCLIYAITHALSGEPAITILLFGLLLENGHYISSNIRKVVPTSLYRFFDFAQISEKRVFTSIFSELTFLVRSFFFVLIGLIIDLRDMTVGLWVAAIIFIFIFYIGRKIVVFLFERLAILPPLTKNIGDLFIPRGLATVVVALIVAERVPTAKALIPISFVIIIGSNLVMTVMMRSRLKPNEVIQAQ
jgi:cell volume regulation protein A